MCARVEEWVRTHAILIYYFKLYTLKRNISYVLNCLKNKMGLHYSLLEYSWKAVLMFHTSADLLEIILSNFNSVRRDIIII